MTDNMTADIFHISSTAGHPVWTKDYNERLILNVSII